MRKTVLSLFLFSTLGFAYNTDKLFESYSSNTGKRIESTTNLLSNYVATLYGIFVGTKDRNFRKGSYEEKAWLFENTMALLGTFSDFGKEVSYDVYKERLKKLIGLIDSGRLQNFSDADDDGTVKEDRLQAYYTAVAIGVLAGIGPGFIAFPDKEQGNKYGDVMLPIYKYRVSMQQLRVAVLTTMTYRVAYNRAELATLYYFADQYCRGKLMEDATKRITVPQENIKFVTGSDCCSSIIAGLNNVIASIKDLKVALLTALDVLAGQNASIAQFACLSILTQLHNAKINLDLMELTLYNLSTNYNILASIEKEKSR